MQIEEHVPFKRITTFKVGGTVRFLITIESPGDLEAAVTFAKDKNLPLIPLGGGSNVLGADGELEAVVVTQLGRGGIEEDDGTIKAGAGVLWDDLVSFAVERNLWGIENLAAIPGTVGGAVVQNIGAYGAVLSDVFVAVDVFDTHTGTRRSLSKEECRFGYRTSLFKQEPDRYLILCLTISLSKTAKPVLEYKDLRERFGSSEPSLSDIRSAVTHIRSQKFPSLAEYGTAGSFFLNPIMTAEEAAHVQEKYPEMPVFPLPEGGVKVPIAWFLEHILELKGVREGFVHTWRDHVLVLVADEGATATDVKNFMEKIATRAKTELGIEIHPEVRVL